MDYHTNGAGGFSLASFGGEGGGEEIPYLQAIGRLMGSLPVLRDLHGDHEPGRKTPVPSPLPARSSRGEGDGAEVAKQRFMERSSPRAQS